MTRQNVHRITRIYYDNEVENTFHRVFQNLRYLSAQNSKLIFNYVSLKIIT
jgi:hypothetical protein